MRVTLALLAGVATVAAPCTLPMLPILLGVSIGQTGKARPAMIALGFVMSFSAVALLLSAITRAFDFDPNLLRTGAAVLLAGFGLLMIWPAPFEWLSIRLSGAAGSLSQAAPSQSLFGGFVLGTTLGLVWTPCAGPVLGSILAKDGFLPRQLHTRGDRLAYSNGILILAAAAAALIVAYKAEVNSLIQLYIVGVFVSFTLSQSGMIRHWNRHLAVEQDVAVVDLDRV